MRMSAINNRLFTTFLCLILFSGIFSCKIKKEGRLCINGVCRSLPPLSGTVNFIVDYPEKSGLMSQQFHNVNLKNGNITLKAKYPVSINGIVDNGNTEFNGTVTFQLKDSIDATSGYFSSDVNQGLFITEIPAGDYNVLIIPDNPDLPVIVKDINIEDSTKETTLKFDYDGKINIYSGTVLDSEGHPMSGLNVRLFSGSTPISADVTTDENGMFKVSYLTNLDPDHILLTPTQGPKIVRTVEFDPYQSDIIYGNIPPITKISARVKTGIYEETPELIWNFYYLIDGEFHISKKGSLVDAEVPEGKYLVLIVPDQSSLFSITAKTFNIPEQEVELQMKRKIYVEGTLTLFNGNPAAATSLIFKRISGFVDEHDTVMRKYTTETDKDGSFHILVDEGLYDIQVEPPRGSSVPAYIMTNIYMLDGTNNRLDIKLPQAAQLKGIVLDPNGDTVSDSHVRVYIKNDSSDKSVYKLIEEVQTDQNGNFEMVLPLSIDYSRF